MLPHLPLLAQFAGPADTAVGVGLGLGIGFFLLFFALIGTGLALFAFWVWMLIDCAQAPEDPANNRVAWILILVFTSWLGALLYFFIVRQPRLARARTSGPFPPPPFAPPAR
jgi:hypothetical protein